MTRIKEFAIALGIVFGIFVVVGIILPSKRSYSFSVETNRPMETVYDFLNGFQRVDDWFPMKYADPNIQLQISEQEIGVGATLEYNSSSRSIGKGSWRMIESVPGEKIVFRVENDDMGGLKTARFKLEKSGRGMKNVQITQIYTVEYGFNLIGRYAGLYLARYVGSHTKKAMRNLADQLAAVPRYDYRDYPFEIKLADMPAMNVLRAPATSRRANNDIAVAMTNQMQWIEKVISDSNLEKAGPMRIVTIDFGSETYTFDVVQPIRTKGSASTVEESAENGSAQSVDQEQRVALPVEPLPQLAVKILGDGNPVVYEQTPQRSVVATMFTGPAPGLARTRAVLRAWAMVRGLKPIEYAYDDYLGEIKFMLNDDAEYKVYLPIESE